MIARNDRVQPRNRLVYILGASHSGSTLLSLLLNAHPGVATIGELASAGIKDPARYRCSCGSLIEQCSFWRHIQREAAGRGVNFRINDFGTRFHAPDSALGRLLMRPLMRGRLLEAVRDAGLSLLPQWHRRSAAAVKANLALIELILQYYRAAVFVDKGNVALRLKYLLRIRNLDIRAVRIIRDGRAVALTYTDPATFADASRQELRGGGSGAAPPETRLSMAEAAYQWRRCNEEIEHALALLDPTARIDVRYEELCTAPGPTLERLFTFMGLAPHLSAANFRGVEHHIVGNGMRMDRESVIRLDERWRTTLSPDELRTFDAVAGPLNRKYGYA